jgi:anti-sigma factor RsiW
MMKCEVAVALVLELLEGTLSPEVRRSLESHLAKCQPCNRLVATYRRTVQLCRRALLRKPPPEFGDRLLAFLRERTLPNKGE